LEITATAVINPYVEKGLEDVSNLVKQGQGLYGPLEKLEVFPPMVIQMTRLGEESGTLEEMMLQTAEFFDEEAQAAITKLTAMMEPLIILMLGGIVLYVVLAILIPVFSSYSMV